jgi:hypothetical protein
MRWILFFAACIGFLFGAPLFFEGANTPCGAFLARSVTEQKGSILLLTMARSGVMGPKWLGPEEGLFCTIRYWRSFGNSDALEPLPKD